MKKLTFWIGIIWGLLGVANVILSSAWDNPSLISMVIVFNFVLFVCPGLILIHIGRK